MLPCICELKKNLQIFEMSLASYQFVHVFHYCGGKPVEEDKCVTLSHSGHLLDDIYENFYLSTHSLAISK